MTWRRVPRSVFFLLVSLLARGLGSGVDWGDNQPGTLLLNMLIKDEAENLERSLPKWAPLIDYWIVGVDSKNTDNSEEVIKKHLGHIPGEIMIVEFDGMGPTWTQLVKRGLVAFPNATHGIVSDADFTPLQSSLDKHQLRRECSKHLYRIRSQDSGTTRNMDWIYRNVEGARVERRTHQSVMVPDLPGQTVYQTLVDLTVQEFAGGYQDRSGQKSERYMGWLLKDLEEMPDDPRTIYYLGHANLDMIGPNAARDVQTNGPGAKHVHEALRYFKWRASLRWGYHEERWFAMLKAGEICERYLFDHKCSLEMWHMASRLDPERVDAWFYIGQHHRLAGEFADAVHFLSKAVSIAFPPRSLFQWEYLYNCLRHQELGRAVRGKVNADKGDWRTAKRSMKALKEKCPSGFDKDMQDILSRAKAETKKEKRKGKEVPQVETEEGSREQTKNSKGGDQAKNGDSTENDRSNRIASPEDVRSDDLQFLDWQSISGTLNQFAVWYSTWHRGIDQVLISASESSLVSQTDFQKHIVQVVELLQLDKVDCPSYNNAVEKYLHLFDQHYNILRKHAKSRPDRFWTEWLEVNLRLWPRCRGH